MLENIHAHAHKDFQLLESNPRPQENKDHCQYAIRSSKVLLFTKNKLLQIKPFL